MSVPYNLELAKQWLLDAGLDLIVEDDGEEEGGDGFTEAVLSTDDDEHAELSEDDFVAVVLQESHKTGELTVRIYTERDEGWHGEGAELEQELLAFEKKPLLDWDMARVVEIIRRMNDIQVEDEKAAKRIRKAVRDGRKNKETP